MKIISKYKKTGIMLLIALIATFIYTMITQEVYGLINGLFTFGWIYLIIGAFEYASAKGVFDLVVYSNKKFWQRLNPKKNDQKVYQDIYEYQASKEEFTTDFQFLLTGLGMITMTTFVSIIIILI